MKTYNALSKSFTDEVKTIMGEGKTIDEAFREVKKEMSPTKPDYVILTEGDGIKVGDYYYVDLGLSVKWATCNIGASLAVDKGLLYQWRGTKGCEYDSTDDNALNIFSEDEQTSDTAQHIMGDTWSTPTTSDWDELFNNENIERGALTITIGEKQIAGMLFTSKKTGYEGKRLFIPFIERYWEGYRKTFLSVNQIVYLWSSSEYNDTNAYRISCDWSGNKTTSYARRVNAYPVRGVIKPATTLEEI